jgi:hypothetical protein
MCNEDRSVWIVYNGEESVRYLGRHKDKRWVWNGLRVLLVDGTSCQLPDTPENQDSYPQPTGQKPGCGQPVMQLLGLFDLANGALLKWEKSPWNASESGMFGTGLHELLGEGDTGWRDRLYILKYNR